MRLALLALLSTGFIAQAQDSPPRSPVANLSAQAAAADARVKAVPVPPEQSSPPDEPAIQPAAPSSTVLLQPSPQPGDSAVPDKNPQVEQLGGVTVRGKRDPFAAADEKLRKLQDSLPCAGCDVTPVRPGGEGARILDAIGDYVAHEVMPTPPPDHSKSPEDQALEHAQEGQCINIGWCTPANAAP